MRPIETDMSSALPKGNIVYILEMNLNCGLWFNLPHK